jgi:3-methyladenine DNA glycosylase AlkD
MPAKTKLAPNKSTRASAQPPVEDQVQSALAWLEQHASKRIRDEMKSRYGITASKAYGVSMANIQLLAKQLGQRHELAAALWDTGWYEARTLAAFVEEPERVTSTQMDYWCREFDNWAICDTMCFKLFDRTPHAWRKVTLWSNKPDELVKRAAFALLASLALHVKGGPEEPFLESLSLIERAAADERNFVKKAVSWALRAVGMRSRTLHRASLTLAQRLAAEPAAPARWVGKDALKALTKPALLEKLAK